MELSLLDSFGAIVERLSRHISRAWKQYVQMSISYQQQAVFILICVGKYFHNDNRGKIFF